jgi:16S rRNA (guanine966-N2)-methyltransferase
LRIIGGSNKRRTIKVPSGLPVRPTTDLAKEALFNILNNHFDFESIRVLDLFSGTGNIAFEFASRGAVEVIAVEKDSRCSSHINNTIKIFKYEQMVAVRADAFRFLKNCRRSFDIVFADPPYDKQEIVTIP